MTTAKNRASKGFIAKIVQSKDLACLFGFLKNQAPDLSGAFLFAAVLILANDT